VPFHENVLRLRMDTPAESINVTSNMAERGGSEAYYVNVPSSGLIGRQPCDESVTGSNKAMSCSTDGVAEEASYVDSLDLVITEPDDAMQLSDSQKCNCCIV